MSKTFDRYDERMLPMFATLSAEADRRGFCDTYDSIAATVGAPSRGEIKRLTMPPLPEEDGFYIAADDLAVVGHPGPHTLLWKRYSGTWYKIHTGDSGRVTTDTPDVAVTRLIIGGAS